ncbi:uncharacterized protein LOC101893397 [Musca domestica]|uniref:Uncharacterized protein LOC101893397 n=2 Tax=Musca domestica TaxID=7370 RepID=A0A1I8MQD0_MUSDO|nr:uncharacterized protein LOC101893397 [Musca domestica]
MNWNIIVLSAVIANFAIAGVESSCSIQLPTADVSIRPKIQKKIGTHYVDVLDESERIYLTVGEEIAASCDTRFASPSFVDSYLAHNFLCEDSGFLAPTSENYRNYYGDQYHNDFLLSCEAVKWNLYESSFNYSWCENSLVSYILARPTPDGNNEYLAEICYNLRKRQIVSMIYLATANKTNHPSFQRFIHSMVEIKNIAGNFPLHGTVSSSDNQHQHWIDFARYEPDTIVQNPKLAQNFKDGEFGGLFNVAWWPGLRLGNWLFYEQAFGQHLEAANTDYIVFAGVSDSVSVPIYESDCHKNRSLAEVVITNQRQIPLYVWQYLKPKGADKGSVVIIGVNSPFAEFYKENDLIFCTDICHTIEWLKNVRYTFGYKNLGVVFCCQPEDVAYSNRLESFVLPAEIEHLRETKRIEIEQKDYVKDVMLTSTERENDNTNDYNEEQNNYEEDLY